MKKLIFSLVVFSLLFLTSCGGGDTAKENDNTDNEVVTDLASLDLAVTEKYHTLDPIEVRSVVSFHLVSQVYEPLLRLDEKDLSLQPLLAESWEVSDDNLVHTFSLKKGVFFQDNDCFENGKGREVKASDVVYSFQRIYSAPSSYAFSLYKNKIKGWEDVANAEDFGVKATDDYTVEFTLIKPSSNFLSLLATISSSVVAKEAVDKDAVAGSGPFIYRKENDTETEVTLLRNENYHISDSKGNKLPYLSAVTFNYVNAGQEQLDAFMADKLDVITDIPPESIKDIVESQIADFQDKPVKYVLGRYPQVSTSFLNLNTNVIPFDNIKVRQAVAMAINKGKIVNDVLKGEAYGAGDHGVVPSAIKNYDYSSVVGHEYNVSKAKQLLAEAGYPNGDGFPTLIFGTGKGNRAVRVALEIQKQLLSNLNINVEISSLTLKEIMDMNSKSQLNLSLSGWLGEFPDPVSYLSLFYGADVPASGDEKSYPNESRYKNAKFDELYEQALVTIDNQKRYEVCLEADQIIATDVPVIPLWYHENYQLIQSIVKGYQPNSMNIQYLTHVKLEKAPKEDKQ
jgi:ABC-type transport system substrate-binding protein